MAHATTFLDPETVLAIAWPILEEHLQDFGVQGLQLGEEIDFDGEPILRLGAITERPFTALAMTHARDAIRVELLKRDDRRSVYIRQMTGSVVR
jgi:hypothetical protein